MQKYTIQQLGETKDKTRTIEKTFQLYKRNNTEITQQEIKDITKSFLEKADKNTKIMIRALGIDKYNTVGTVTLKDLNDNLNVLDEEEFAQAKYYEGHVKDVNKFKKFSQLEFIIIKTK
jgi:hypothetical protein